MAVRTFLSSIGLLMLSLNIAFAGQLDDFSSDGCSLFPDGTPGEQTLWCDCCVRPAWA